MILEARERNRRFMDMELSGKEKDILKTLLKCYKDFGSLKDSGALRKGYFKYSAEEAEAAVHKLISPPEEGTAAKKSAVRDEIQKIDNIEMAKQFYLEHLVYDKEDAEAKKKCLKSISLDELKLLYKKIYSEETRSKITKEEALLQIEKYFNGIERALSMKP